MVMKGWLQEKPICGCFSFKTQAKNTEKSRKNYPRSYCFFQIATGKMMKKRGREDGQISKEDYMLQEEQEEREGTSTTFSSFQENVSLLIMFWCDIFSYVIEY